MLIFTAWLIGARFKIRPDSNWPFVYYTVLVFFHQSLPGVLTPMPIYIAVVCALFLRFEFMSNPFRGVFRFAEAFGLAYVITALFNYVGL
jgi:hypothetical protein